MNKRDGEGGRNRNENELKDSISRWGTDCVMTMWSPEDGKTPSSLQPHFLVMLVQRGFTSGPSHYHRSLSKQ